MASTLPPAPRAGADDAPAVSVIIPTVDREKLLLRAIRSVVAQDYLGPIEIVVVRDGSPSADDTAALEQTMAAELPASVSLRQVPNIRSKGLPGARNSGIQAASHTLVAFCDDDDSWLADKLERQVAALNDSGALTSVTGVTIVYADTTADRVPTQEQMELRSLVRHRVMAAHPSTVLVRRAALLGPIGLVDEQIPGSYGEDFDWIIRAVQAGTVAVVQAPLVRVMWGQSLFSSKWPTIVEAIDYVLAKHPIFHEDRRALARLYGRRSFALAAMGRRVDALRGAAKTVALSPREGRAVLATAVALRVVSAERLMDLAHRRGHGI